MQNQAYFSHNQTLDFFDILVYNNKSYLKVEKKEVEIITLDRVLIKISRAAFSVKNFFSRNNDESQKKLRIRKRRIINRFESHFENYDDDDKRSEQEKWEDQVEWNEALIVRETGCIAKGYGFKRNKYLRKNRRW